jgi:pimeloyl-ACP methyl ester carboxylesterase
MLHPVAFSRKIARGIPHAESVIIPESGHATIFEQPNVVTSVLLGFIGKSPVS